MTDIIINNRQTTSKYRGVSGKPGAWNSQFTHPTSFAPCGKFTINFGIYSKEEDAAIVFSTFDAHAKDTVRELIEAGQLDEARCVAYESVRNLDFAKATIALVQKDRTTKYDNLAADRHDFAEMGDDYLPQVARTYPEARSARKTMSVIEFKTAFPL